MRTVAYLTNRFPEATESYVAQEISELRRRGIAVIPFSAQAPSNAVNQQEELGQWSAQTIQLRPLRLLIVIPATLFCLRKLILLSSLFARILFRGDEPLYRRLRAVAHTFLGAYSAILLKSRRVEHIHVHHGYFGCWIAMVAARLLAISYSVTLHGSDLLLHKAYLDEKLTNCKFCVTISEFNRRYIFNQFPAIDSSKIFVRNMGVNTECEIANRRPDAMLRILAVGRLNPVKNHQFLIEACARLKGRGHQISCVLGCSRPRLTPTSGCERMKNASHAFWHQVNL